MQRRTLPVVSAAAALTVAAMLVALVLAVQPSAAEDGEVPLNPAIKPEAVLSPGQSVTLESSTPLFGTTTLYSPEECRGRPSTADANGAQLSCRAHRIALNLDANPEALNIVIIEAEFGQLQVQSLPIVAAGLNPPPVNSLNVYVWDWEDHYLGQDFVTPALQPVLGPATPTTRLREPTRSSPPSAAASEPSTGCTTSPCRPTGD